MMLCCSVLTQAEPPLKLCFGGDIMLNQVSIKTKPLSRLAPIFRSADLAFANLEVPLTTAKTATTRKTAEELRNRDQYILKADPRHIIDIKSSGIRIVSLGNNHAMDYGGKGLLEMHSSLANAGIAYAGAGANAELAMAPAFVSRKKKRIALLSVLAFMSKGGLWKCSPATSKSAGVGVLSFGGTINAAAKTKLKSWIGRAKEKSDVVVIGLHWGIERKTLPSAYQVAFGRACVEAGADIVWGHHPHVLQGAELYKGKPILYSLGNLVAPRSGETALISVNLESDRPKLQAHRVVFRNGSASPAQGSTSLANLSAQIQKSYPSKQSENPFAPRKVD
ncbi:PgsA Putative enzyme of poly-gamma-glutamate biosynthesis (capsule formation) [Fimbriimonadaceae bacterium]